MLFSLRVDSTQLKCVWLHLVSTWLYSQFHWVYFYSNRIIFHSAIQNSLILSNGIEVNSKRKPFPIPFSEDLWWLFCERRPFPRQSISSQLSFDLSWQCCNIKPFCFKMDSSSMIQMGNFVMTFRFFRSNGNKNSSEKMFPHLIIWCNAIEHLSIDVLFYWWRAWALLWRVIIYQNLNTKESSIRLIDIKKKQIKEHETGLLRCHVEERAFQLNWIGPKAKWSSVRDYVHNGNCNVSWETFYSVEWINTKNSTGEKNEMNFCLIQATQS